MGISLIDQKQGRTTVLLDGVPAVQGSPPFTQGQLSPAATIPAVSRATALGIENMTALEGWSNGLPPPLPLFRLGCEVVEELVCEAVGTDAVGLILVTRCSVDAAGLAVIVESNVPSLSIVEDERVDVSSWVDNPVELCVCETVVVLTLAFGVLDAATVWRLSLFGQTRRGPSPAKKHTMTFSDCVASPKFSFPQDACIDLVIAHSPFTQPALQLPPC